MAPTTERTAPTKKSLRIWVRNNGHVMRKKTRITYVYPRTVEAAKDPFECATGKNKMFYLIAINLYPESKIIRPDDSDSETEMEEKEITQTDSECNIEETPSNSKMEKCPVAVDKKRSRTRRSPTAERAINSASETLEPHHCSSENSERNQPSVPESTSQKKIANSAPSKNSCQRQRLLPLKKTSLKKNNANMENKECSKFSDCEDSLSSSKSREAILSNNKIKVNEVMTKGATALTARKLPAIPTIMNSLNKIIETCSASGAVSFSLAKKKPRQSRS